VRDGARAAGTAPAGPAGVAARAARDTPLSFVNDI
jgi:hypothetical protein